MRPWIPVVLWVGMIALFSTDLASRSTTETEGFDLLGRLLPSVAEGLRHASWTDEVITPIRKLGHLTEYGTLGFLTNRALLRTTALSRRQRAATVLAGVLVVAGLDELHQTTVPTRTGTPIDVGIDLVGACLGLLLGNRLSRRPSPSR